MKKTYIIIAAILLLAACIAFPRNKDPETIAECWYCSELDFVLNVTPEKSELIWHDKQYEVIIGFRAGSGYDVFVENGDGIVSQEEILFRGTWTCKRGKLVLKINDDRLFEGAYNQLTFEPLKFIRQQDKEWCRVVIPIGFRPFDNGDSTPLSPRGKMVL